MSLKELCRSCLRSGQAMCSLVDSIVPKFDTPSNAVVELWKIFTKVLIATEDSFPDKICTDCLIEIQRTYLFMLKCERYEDILKTMKNVEIRLEKLATVSPLHEHDGLKYIKSENDIYDNIEWIDSENGYDDSDSGQIQAINQANVYSHIRPQSQHTSIVQPEDKLASELLDQLDCDNDKKYEVLAIQGIKHEPELDICSEIEEFDKVKYDDQTSIDFNFCPDCRFKCETIEDLKKHIIDNHMEGKLCQLCNREFECSAVEHCSEHLQLTDRKSNVGKVAFKCESCPKTFIRKRNLREHLKLYHTGERPFKCESCPKGFIYKNQLLRHSTCHTGERPFKCNICPKTFPFQNSLMYHEKSHNGKRPFKCEKCSKVYGRKNNLTLHINRGCDRRNGPFKCEICPTTFLRKKGLNQHSKLYHTGEILRSFKCEICSKAFIRKIDLIEHSTLHTGDRPFKCEICPKSFLRKHRLTEHAKSHTENGLTDCM